MSDDAPVEERFEELATEFQSARPKYEAFVGNIASLLSSLLRAKGIEHLPIEGRTKSIESFKAKLARPEKEEKYKSIVDMTDLAGVRVVAYYEKDVEQICDVITSNFEVDEKNSSDKTGTIEADRFGYLSKHFVVKHGHQRSDLPENRQFRDLKVEIQIRTVVQHAWAVIDRRLRYNNEADIPRELRRKLFRVSALLELADKEFSEIDTAVAVLREKYKRGVSSGDLQFEVNRDSVEVFLASSETMKRIRALAMAVGIGASNSDGGITEFIKTISAAGLYSIEQVDELLRSDNDLSAKFEAYVSARRKSGVRGVKWNNAFLARVSVLFSLPKAKAFDAFNEVPFAGSGAARTFRSLIAPRSRAKG